MNEDKSSLELEFECYSAMITIQETFREIYEIMGVDLGLAIRTASSALDTIKKIADLVDKTKNVELQESIIELRTQLLEIKENLVEVKEENFELKQENKALKDQLEEIEKIKAESIVLKNNLYYKEGDDTPHCPKCFEGSKKLRHLVEGSLFAGIQGVPSFLKCPECNNQYPKTR